MKVFAPYLSNSLLHKIALYRLCTSDWFRKNPNPSLKAPVGLFENGIFSGAYEKSKPQSYHIEKTVKDNSGNVRVYVQLNSVSTPAPPEVWQVAVLLSRESGEFVVTDIIYLKDDDYPADERLSDYFSRECRGSHFVGLR